jgi:MFS transporter, DHA1 family, multidrug resistance protein
VQGAALGLSNSFVSLGRFGGALGAGVLFDFRMEFPYLVGAGILLAGLLASLVWLRQVKKQPLFLG